MPTLIETASEGQHGETAIDASHLDDASRLSPEEQPEAGQIYTPERTSAEPVPLNAIEIKAWQAEAVAALQHETNRAVMAAVLQRALETASGVSAELLSTENPVAFSEKIAPFPGHEQGTGYSVVVERLPLRLAASIGANFDKNLFTGISDEPPVSLQRTASGFFEAPEKLADFGAILYKYLGEEVFDIAFAILEFGTQNQDSCSLPPHETFSHDERTKRSLFALTIGISRTYGFDEEKTVRWALGERLYKKLQGEDKECDVATILSRFKERFLSNAKCRKNCMAALSCLQKQADTYLAAVYTLQGVNFARPKGRGFVLRNPKAKTESWLGAAL